MVQVTHQRLHVEDHGSSHAPTPACGGRCGKGFAIHKFPENLDQRIVGQAADAWSHLVRGRGRGRGRVSDFVRDRDRDLVGCAV